MTTIYMSNEIARHDHDKDLWIVIHGDVYDLTKFYKEHPGGEEVLLKLAGKDGSECFDSIGHSFEAITLRNTFKIGEMEENGILEKPKAKAGLTAFFSSLFEKSSHFPSSGFLTLQDYTRVSTLRRFNRQVRAEFFFFFFFFFDARFFQFMNLYLLVFHSPLFSIIIATVTHRIKYRIDIK